MSRVLDDAFESPLRDEEHASMLLAGGIMQHGYQCGMIWGAALAAGARAYRQYRAGPRAEQATITTAGRLVELFRDRNHHINCLEITEIDKSPSTWDMIKFFLIKGGSIGCIRRAAKYAPVALDGIAAALSEDSGEPPEAPVSCAAAVARKMGATDLQATAVSGFAGGIGLCGGGCGALAAALWMIALKSIGEQNGKLTFENAPARKAMEMFCKGTDYKFECTEIVGRKFESVADHAAYMRDGGCSEIIETLAECK